MKTIIKDGIVAIVAFSYLYSISYAYIPFNFPFVLGILGIIIFFSSQDDRQLYGGVVKYLLRMMFLPIAISIMALIVNGSFDLSFTKLLITNIFYLFGAYLLIKIIKWGKKRVEAGTIVNFFIISAVIQCVLTMILFLNPSIANSLQSLLQYNEIAQQSLDRTEGTRLIGFGAYFFSSGLIHGLVLLFIVIQIFYRRNNTSFSITLYILSWILIVVVGAMLARTTFVGAASSMALLFFILFFKNASIPKRKIYLSIFTLIALGAFFIERLSATLDLGEYEDIMHFGFEMFYNYDKTGSFSTSSSNGMLENMLVFPDNLATWILGDGLWMDPSNPYRYYMHTDIGYSRMIFQFGLIGLFVFIVFQYKIINYSIKKVEWPKLFVFVFFIYMLVLNIKGFADMLLYFAPFAFLRGKINTRQVQK